MRAALVALLIASPAVAQEVRFEETAEGLFLHYQNEMTEWVQADGARTVEDMAVQTKHGTVRLRLVRTLNALCAVACPDTLEVLETPPGTVAVPPVVELPEGATTVVRIIEFLGI